MIAGEGPMRAQLKEQIDALGLGKRVSLPGLMPHGKVLGMLSNSTAAVLPSRQENFSIFALEALALEKPLVASAVGGLPELIENGHSGVTIDAEDREAFATALLRVATEQQYSRTLAREGHKRLKERFTQERSLRMTIEVYSEVSVPVART